MIVYNTKITQIDNTLLDFNLMRPSLKFTVSKETDNNLNYLDLTIQDKKQKFNFAIYRKPTTTDHIIHQDSCHPWEHKKAGILYPADRMNTYPAPPEMKQNEK
jgi:DNA mismatch repair ATPase MutL